MNLSQKTILVTGAASGLGSACVQHLRTCGAQVVSMDIRSTPAATAGPGCHVMGDVSQEDDVRRALASARQLGGLHGVVNCAGILRAGRAISRRGPYSLHDFTDVIRVNLIGTFNVVRLAAEMMIDNLPDQKDGERGVIVNTSSVAAFDGQIGQAAYSASKGGVASMTLPLARELAQFGVRVVAIAPGVFETPMMEALPDAARESLAAQIPFPKRLGKPSEFAALVQHVFENVMLNGTVLRLDGALRMESK
jgi:NAD(P)-dependent dehydrogenase (short-subunit alcohol dehydrogenase family)